MLVLRVFVNFTVWSPIRWFFDLMPLAASTAPILKQSFEDLEAGVSHLICCFWNDFAADCVLLIVYNLYLYASYVCNVVMICGMR